MDSVDMNLSKSWEKVEDRGAWRAAAPGVTKSQTWLSDWTITFYTVENFINLSTRLNILCETHTHTHTHTHVNKVFLFINTHINMSVYLTVIMSFLHRVKKPVHTHHYITDKKHFSIYLGSESVVSLETAHFTVQNGPSLPGERFPWLPLHHVSATTVYHASSHKWPYSGPGNIAEK